MEDQTKEVPLMNEMYESALVSFGNYLLKKYKVKNQPDGTGLVTHADLSNWRATLDEQQDLKSDAPAAEDEGKTNREDIGLAEGAKD